MSSDENKNSMLKVNWSSDSHDGRMFFSYCYHIYCKYSDTIFYLNFERPLFCYLLMCFKAAGRIANNADLDPAVSDPGLHCFNKYSCPNT